MEEPYLALDDSTLFPVRPSVNDVDFGDSLLFASTNDNMEIEQESASEMGKLIRLFDGTTKRLKPKIRTKIDTEDIRASEDMDLIDMDELFRKANERLAVKNNQNELEQQQGPQNIKSYKPSKVWTEKYRPTRFVDLCSAGNDKQYRAISHWLSKWSSTVFNIDTGHEQNNVDALGRPYRKILLVTGPPGIGKTTAVHLIAKQFGYSVEELNAANSMDTLPSSTERNYGSVSSALKLKIQNALTSNSIQTQGSKLSTKVKPTCLVIDEVDTSGNSSDIIRVLNELIQGDQRAMNSKVNKTNQKKKKDMLLNRPIICIANDAYTTSSRTWGGFTMDKLRGISEMVQFQKPAFIKRASGIKAGGSAINSVKEYIKTISENERLNLEYKEINEIVEVCEGDIRASINHLQFNGRRLDNYVSKSDTTKSNKDLELSWFKLTDMLFKRDPQLSKEEDFDSLMEIVMSSSGKSVNSGSGTLEKVVRGCFNKYLDIVHYQDDSLIRPNELSDWLDFYDRAGGVSGESSHYANLILMKIWQLFSEISPKRIHKSLLPEIKNIEFQSFESRKKTQQMVKAFISSIPVSLKVSLGGGFENNDSMGLFIIPQIHKMIFPELESVGTSILKSKNSLNDFDKQCLEKAANIFKTLKFELQSFRDYDTNQIALEISPNLDHLVMYETDGNKLKQLDVKRKWYFPMLQTEVDRLEMFNRSVKRSVVESQKDKPSKKSKVSSSIEFFKGQYDGISTQIQPAKKKDDSTRIWVKYNEGYSNAVRKTIGWNEFWNVI